MRGGLVDLKYEICDIPFTEESLVYHYDYKVRRGDELSSNALFAQSKHAQAESVVLLMALFTSTYRTDKARES